MQTAIRKSFLYNTPYAIIVEDDVSFNFEIDFKCLFQNAPKNFGAIQLVTSNVQELNHFWNKFLSNRTNLFSKRSNECWSIQGYIINTSVVRNFVMKALEFNRTTSSYQLNFIPLGLFEHACKTRAITSDEITKLQQRIHSYTSYSSKGIEVYSVANINDLCWLPENLYVESFLFGGYPSYISNIPLLNSGDVGLVSTVHQKHVDLYHKPAFNRIDNIVNSLNTSGEYPPCFASRKFIVNCS